MGEQSANLGSEQPLPCRRPRQVQRLDADTVADQMQGGTIPVAAVIDGKRKHPVEPVDTIEPPLLVRVQDHLGVGVIGPPRVLPKSLELSSDLGVVVDLAVEYEGNGFVVVHHWLRGVRRHVDDRQSTVSERAAPILRCPKAEAIRTPMSHPVAHASDDLGARGCPAGPERADDATHLCYERTTNYLLSAAQPATAEGNDWRGVAVRDEGDSTAGPRRRAAAFPPDRRRGSDGRPTPTSLSS